VATPAPSCQFACTARPPPTVAMATTSARLSANRAHLTRAHLLVTALFTILPRNSGHEKVGSRCLPCAQEPTRIGMVACGSGPRMSQLHGDLPEPRPARRAHRARHRRSGRTVHVRSCPRRVLGPCRRRRRCRRGTPLGGPLRRSQLRGTTIGPELPLEIGGMRASINRRCRGCTSPELAARQPGGYAISEMAPTPGRPVWNRR